MKYRQIRKTAKEEVKWSRDLGSVRLDKTAKVTYNYERKTFFNDLETVNFDKQICLINHVSTEALNIGG
jgi:hypothetical protein